MLSRILNLMHCLSRVKWIPKAFWPLVGSRGKAPVLLLLMTARLSAAQVEDVVIIGSGPAAYTAAIYAARADLRPLIIQGDEGGQIVQSVFVENFPGFPDGVSGLELMERMRTQAERFGTRVLVDRVEAVDFSLRPFALGLESGEEVFARAVIIATGASPKWLGLESELALLGKSVSSCAVCDGAFYRGLDVVVVGGGDSALEDALLLSRYARSVTVVHRRGELRASEYLKSKAFSVSNIRFIWNSEVIDIAEDGVTLKSVDGLMKYPCHGVFIAIGHIPNSSLFSKFLETDKNGYLVTRPQSTATSIPGVFAAGDVVDSTFRQAITAAGSGCMAGIEVYHYLQSLKE